MDFQMRVLAFRCCEDCKLYPTCKNAGYGCCNYKLYEPEDDDKEENDNKENVVNE